MVNGIPYFAPRRASIANRSVTGSKLSSEPANQFLSKVLNIIQNRPRKYQARNEGVKIPKHWWRWKEHRRPTLWVLYRGLLKNCKKFEEEIAVDEASKIEAESSIRQKNFGKGRLNDHLMKQKSNSSKSFFLENWIRSQFKTHRMNRNITHTQELLRKSYKLLDQLTRACSSKDEIAKQSVIALKLRLMETKRREEWAKVYRKELEEKCPPKPIMTGRFLRPTIFNGPLPRLAHQPLHISMMISSRRKAHERRLKQQKMLKENLQMLKQEHQFEKDLGHDLALSQKDINNEFGFINDRLKEISNTFVLEKERERKVYSRELLDKIELARRRRPVVMNQRNVWNRIKKRNNEIAFVTDPTNEE